MAKQNSTVPKQKPAKKGNTKKMPKAPEGLYKAKGMPDAPKGPYKDKGMPDAPKKLSGKITKGGGKKLSAFGSAFATARKNNLKEFIFKGKKYTTKVK